jgi:hypothetical protein
MARRWRTFMAARFGPTLAGASSGKKEITESSRLSRPSSMANAVAVAVKLFVREKSSCGT